MSGIGTSLETRAIWELSRSAWYRALGWRYKRIFGKDAGKGQLHLIYGLLDPPQAVNQAGEPVRHIFAKRESPGLTFSASGVVSICEVRAVTYVAESVSENTGRGVILRSDRAVLNSLDLSFVSFGIFDNACCPLRRSVGDMELIFGQSWARRRKQKCQNRSAFWALRTGFRARGRQNLSDTSRILATSGTWRTSSDRN